MLRFFRPLLIIILFSSRLFGQDVVCLHHQFYTSWFSTTMHIPLMVEYTLTKEMVSCDKQVKRTNRFKPDPLLPGPTSLQRDYTHSGYDRGHNMSAADNCCDIAGMTECFYFSNMTPQPHPFNNGRWKELESMERALVVQCQHIVVYVGSFGPATSSLGPDHVVVPRYMFKVIYRPDNKSYSCYIFPNSSLSTNTVKSYEVSITDFSAQTGISFTDTIPHAVFISNSINIP